MIYNKEEFREALQNIGRARDRILSLYSNSLYEDNWKNSDITEFETQLATYNANFVTIKDMLPYVKWQSPEIKLKFMDQYYKVVEEDNLVFNLVKIRHDAYLVYRTNRKSLISLLNDVVGFVKNKGRKLYIDAFDYFNDTCARVAFYTNKDEAGNITINNTPNLHRWFYSNVAERVNQLNDSTTVENRFSAEEAARVFAKYELCRKMVFKIFNMITSTNKINGYDKWHNILDSYCSADLRDIQLEKLYNAANTEDEFAPSDDQFQIMDDRAWNEKGIYESLNESWFDDEIAYYNLKKRKPIKADIVKIDMQDPTTNVCKVITNGKSMFAGCTFYPDDIIEICPTRTIDKSSLYSKDMREVVFEVVPNQEWVLPFGYCQYYDIQSDTQVPNCDFVWDPVTRVIVIKATAKIKKHEKLILNIKK